MLDKPSYEQLEQLNKELESKLNFFRTLLDYAYDWEIFRDNTGKLIYTSQAIEKIIGYTSEYYLSGKLLFKDFVHPEDLNFVNKEFAKALNHEVVASCEFRMIKSDKSIVFVEVASQPVYNLNHQCVGIRSSIRDITERKKTEASIKARLELNEYSATHSLNEVLIKTLDTICEITDSPIGFYHFIDPTQQIISLQAWSTKTTSNYCHTNVTEMRYPIEKAGVWADCVKTKKPLAHNDYESLLHKKGLPEGHAPLIRELVVPILRNNKVVAILGIGNKATFYNNKDIEFVSFFADIAWEIAERKKTETELKESEEKFRLFFERSPDLIAISNTEGEIIDANNAMLKFHGLNSLDEIRQYKAEDFYANKAERQVVRTEIQNQGYLRNREIQFKSIKKEKISDFLVSLDVMKFVDGSQFYIAWHRDITDIKKLQNELKETATKFSTAFKTAPYGKVISDLKTGQFIEFNEAFAEITGYSEEDFNNNTSFNLNFWINLEDRNYLTSTLQKDGKVMNKEFHFRKKNGKVMIALVTSSLIEINGVLCMLSSFNDISKSKKMEQSLKESEEKFRLLFEKSPDAITITNSKGELIDANEAMLKFHGLHSKAELKNFRSQDTYANKEEREVVISELLNHGNLRNREIQFKSLKNGEIFNYLVSVEIMNFDKSEPFFIAFHRDITEIKEIQNKLTESEAKFSTAFKTAPYGIVISDFKTGKFIEFNKAFAEIIGYAHEELINHTSHKINLWVNANDRNHVTSTLQNGDQIINEEMQFRKKNGEIIFVLISSSIVEIKGMQCILSSFNDITERKRIELENIQQARMLDLIFKHSIDSIVILDKDYNFIRVSEAYLKACQRSISDFAGANHFEFFPPNAKIEFDEAKAKKDIYSRQARPLIYPDHPDWGTTYWDIGLVPVLDKSNEIEFFILTLKDVTKETITEIALKESEKQYRLLYDEVPIGIFKTSLQGKALAGNNAICQILGYDSPEDFLAISDSARQVWVNPAERDEYIRLNEKQGFVYNFQCQYKRKDGTIIWVSLYTNQVKDSEGETLYFSGYLEDITTKKQDEIELEKYRNHLEELVSRRTLELNKEIEVRKVTENELRIARDLAESANKAKTEFLSNMSHELRTPLNAILGFSKLITNQRNITDEQKHQLKTIYSCGEHLLSLINDILDMSKIEANKLELAEKEFNLQSILQITVSINKVKADEKNLKYIFEPKDELSVYALGDERKLKQIMLNLISNAIKFTNDGSVIIRATHEKQSGIFVFEVEDTGIGIPAEKHKEIFEPFVQHTGSQLFAEGAGLGLSITKKLVELMRGHISMKSEPGQGSIFTVTIPLQTIDSKRINRQPEFAIYGYTGKPKRILIVDDNISNIALLVSLLKPINFLVETATNGQQALEMLNEFIPDLILLDHKMPTITGVDFIQQFNQSKSWKNIKVIGISAAITENKDNKIFKELCNSFISKPIDTNLLFNSMKELLQIEWTYNNPNSELEEIISEELILPDENSVGQLIENAEIGNFNEINKIVTDILRQDNKYQVFCDTISKFSKKYDHESIINFLEQKNN